VGCRISQDVVEKGKCFPWQEVIAILTDLSIVKVQIVRWLSDLAEPIQGGDILHS
jgi:hypothetical protein